MVFTATLLTYVCGCDFCSDLGPSYTQGRDWMSTDTQVMGGATKSQRLRDMAIKLMRLESELQASQPQVSCCQNFVEIGHLLPVRNWGCIRYSCSRGAWTRIHCRQTLLT